MSSNVSGPRLADPGPTRRWAQAARPVLAQAAALQLQAAAAASIQHNLSTNSITHFQSLQNGNPKEAAFSVFAEQSHRSALSRRPIRSAQTKLLE